MKRSLAILLCLALALTLLAGCMPALPPLPSEQPMSAEEIRAAALEKLYAAQSMDLDLKLSLSMELTLDGETEAMSLDLELPGELTTAPTAFHSEASARITLGEDGTEDIPFSLYVLPEDEALCLYIRSEADEPYQKLRLPPSDDSAEGSTPTLTLSRLPWELERAETRYVLSHSVSAEEAAQIADTLRAAMPEQNAQALADLAQYGITPEAIYTGMAMRMSVDRESLELRDLSVDFSAGMQTIVRGFIDFILSQLEESMGDLFSDRPEIQINVRHFSVSAALHDYNSVAPIRAPEDYEDLGSLEDLLSNAFGLPGGDYPSQDFGSFSDSLDDSYSLAGFSFRLRETTPRALTEQGWVVTDAVPMRNSGADLLFMDDDSDADETPAETDETPAEADESEAPAPTLTEDGLLEPGGLVQIYLKPEGEADAAYNPLRLGVANEGEEPIHYLDCPIYFFSVNEVQYFEDSSEGLVDFSGPAGVKKGMDPEAIKALLGEPFFENAMDGDKALYYFTRRGETLALLFDSDDLLTAMFYQDAAHYDPPDYVFHN